MVRLPEEILDRINAHGERTYPEECCGMLLGTLAGEDRLIEEVIEIDNSQDENRRRRFLITPGQYMQAERLAAEHDRELLGFYHSHPDHPAIPSSFDTEHALPWFTYVIVSVLQRHAGIMSAWELSDSRERFQERLLTVEPAAVQASGAGKQTM